LKTTHDSALTMTSYPMDKLYAKLTEQHSLLQQQDAQKAKDDENLTSRSLDNSSSSASLPITPAVDTFASNGLTARSAATTPADTNITAEEILRLKLELAQAQSKLSRMDQELAHSRASTDNDTAAPVRIKQEHPSSTMSNTSVSPISSHAIAGGASLNVTNNAPFSREPSWATQDEAATDIADPITKGNMHRSADIWNDRAIAPLPHNQLVMEGPGPMRWPNSRAGTVEPGFAPTGMEVYRQDRMLPDPDVMRPMGRRGGRFDGRYGSSNGYAPGFGPYNMGMAPFEMGQGYPAGPQGMMGGGMGMGMYSPYLQQPVGSVLSPHATEFTSGGPSWKGEVSNWRLRNCVRCH
jgi:hypothetical protein